MSAGRETSASKKPGVLTSLRAGAILSVCLLVGPDLAIVPALCSSAASQEATRASTGPCPTSRGKRLTRTGWFYIDWNGGPTFMLDDGKGQPIRLLLDEAVTRPFGGPRVFNRKRVRIVGVRARGVEALCVVSIAFERDDRSK
jgi:hypothetical protein